MGLETDAIRKHHEGVEVRQIVEEDHVRPIPGGDGPVALEAVGLGSVDGGHLDGLDGGDAVGHRPAQDVIDMALPFDVAQVLVVGAEEHPAGGEMVLGYLAHELLYAAAGGTKADMDAHALAQLLV